MVKYHLAHCSLDILGVRVKLIMSRSRSRRRIPDVINYVIRLFHITIPDAAADKLNKESEKFRGGIPPTKILGK